jgi:signal transduction histidine kinase
MGKPSEKTATQLAALASHLAERQEAILEEWQDIVKHDPEAKVAPTLSLAHFRDMVPKILTQFEEKLRTGSEGDAEQKMLEHGAHRWKEGYSLRELVREWRHLERYMLSELDGYGIAHPEVEPPTMALARQMWLELCGEGICDSVERYSELQRAEASGVLNDLQSAVADVRRMERQRASAWHEAAHDLRGNVGILTTSTAILAQDGAPEPLRAKATETLQKSVSFLLELLEDLMSLARLEAGREQRKLERYDAAARLRELCSALEVVARGRGLFLKAEGPETLMVEGDPAKVQRIIQNLALNALKYTTSGGVTVSWDETLEAEVERWRVRVEDTGPGFHAALGSPISSALKAATDTARFVERDDPRAGAEPVPGQDAPSAPPPDQTPGEGIGLSIVKRLCELLDASLELASTPEGTAFQVVLPRRYSSS